MTVCNVNTDLSKPKGFTLLEVIVSISLIAIVFVALFKMQSGTVELAGSARFNTIAPGLAHQVLADIESDLSDLTESSGEFDNELTGFEWRYQVSDFQAEDIDFMAEENLDALKKIEITITDSESGNTYSLTTWRCAHE